MKRQVCCFSGHREIPQAKIDEIEKSLENEIRKLIKQNVIYYGSGGARGFDMIAAKCVINLRLIFKELKLILVLPFHGHTNNWTQKDKYIFNEVLAKADKVVYTADHYFKGCLHKRNRYLVDNSSHIICYLTKDTGGTKYTADYARTKELNVIQL